MITLPTKFIEIYANQQLTLNIKALDAFNNVTFFENPRWEVPENDLIFVELFHDDEKARVKCRYKNGDADLFITVDGKVGEEVHELRLPVHFNIFPVPAVRIDAEVTDVGPIED